MVYPKFIIEDGNLIIAKCTYHKELATIPENVKGGGWWRMNDNTITFYGESHEFGPAILEDIEKAVKQSKIFSNPSLSRSIASKHKFQYDTQSEIIHLPLHGNNNQTQ